MSKTVQNQAMITSWKKYLKVVLVTTTPLNWFNICFCLCHMAALQLNSHSISTEQHEALKPLLWQSSAVSVPEWTGPSLPLYMQSSGCCAVRLLSGLLLLLLKKPTVHSNLVTICSFECISGDDIVLGNLLFFIFHTLFGKGTSS